MGPKVVYNLMASVSLVCAGTSENLMWFFIRMATPGYNSSQNCVTIYPLSLIWLSVEDVSFRRITSGE